VSAPYLFPTSLRAACGVAAGRARGGARWIRCLGTRREPGGPSSSMTGVGAGGFGIFCAVHVLAEVSRIRALQFLSWQPRVLRIC